MLVSESTREVMFSKGIIKTWVFRFTEYYGQWGQLLRHIQSNFIHSYYIRPTSISKQSPSLYLCFSVWFYIKKNTKNISKVKTASNAVCLFFFFFLFFFSFFVIKEDLLWRCLRFGNSRKTCKAVLNIFFFAFTLGHVLSWWKSAQSCWLLQRSISLHQPKSWHVEF